MNRGGAFVGIVTLLVLFMGTGVHAQQQNPSSQEQVQTQTPSEQKATSDSTTNSDTSTQQGTSSQSGTQSEMSNNPSAETASTLQGVMLACDTIIGATVKNEQGQSVGEIQRLHISLQYGVIKYAELGVGGFLGMGEKTIMVPWQSIEIARNGDSLVLNTSNQLLKKVSE